MNIHRTLVYLTFFLGMSLLFTVGVQIEEQLARYDQAQRLAASNAVRESLAVASQLLGEERVALMLTLAEMKAPNLEEIRRRVDEALAATRQTTQEAEGAIDADGALEAIERTVASLAVVRQDVDAALHMPDLNQRRRFALERFGAVSDIIGGLQSLRLTLLAREQASEPEIAYAAAMRSYANLLIEHVSRNRALLAVSLEIPLLGAEFLDAADRNEGRAELALQLLRDQPVGTLGAGIRTLVNEVDMHHAVVFEPVQRTILAGLRQGKATMAPESWNDTAGRMLALTSRLQGSLFESSRERLMAEVVETRRSLTSWAVLFGLGACAVVVALLVVRERVARPLETLRDVMLRLADGDLAVALPYAERRDEIGAMSDTLRVFKANAIRRKRLQDETLQLHAKLRDAYGQLRRDLEAAAVIQASLLPRPRGTGAVAFNAMLQPSHFIAGDTYNVVDLPNGRAGFFLLDVAGHGAPAALVSVASHHTLTQALLQRWREESLAELAARLNRDWPEDLPYCTMILGEIDNVTGRGALVQAGHPSPLLIGHDGAVMALGTGGLPFGMLPDADFEETAFEMRAGDRLLVYSDGLVEAENVRGECFSDNRLVDLVRDLAGQATPALIDGIGGALRAWRGSSELDDDVSVLVLQHPTQGGTA